MINSQVFPKTLHIFLSIVINPMTKANWGVKSLYGLEVIVPS